ncbi:MAG TPA: SIR2 family protein, partial [Archangium sp.]|nr:SIR2 family protein [Archangium sp.]
LLMNGVDECLMVRPGLGEKWAQRVREEIESGDIDDLLSAAEKIEQKLGGRGGGDYARWLHRTVGSLKVTHPEVPAALRDLGLPLLTTNYDDVLLQVTGWQRLTWKEGSSVERVLRGEDEAVVHLHGHFRQPDTVILGIRSYEKLLQEPHAQAMQQALMALKTLLFVGFGAGFEDPNFGAWLEWRRQALKGSTYPAYRLACGQEETQRFQAQHKPQDRVRVISYSDKGRFDDLAPFLRSLVPEGKSRGKS